MSEKEIKETGDWFNQNKKLYSLHYTQQRGLWKNFEIYSSSFLLTKTMSVWYSGEINI